MTLSYTAPFDRPLSNDELLLECVGNLLRDAGRRQLWMMFLLPDQTLAPAIMPTDDLPVDPHGAAETDAGTMTHAAAVARMVDYLTREFGFAAAVFVWERPSGPDLDERERDWSSALARECAARRVPVRAQFLLTNAGVRRLVPDDDPNPVTAG
jgi:hypothetical protein